ncbi:hypothetical protein Golax_024792 [Gossypium laxum]|nr:hypothetical protein [Gossypium laxum]
MEIFNDDEVDLTPGKLAATFIAFVSVLGFLIMHITLVGANRTTIEFQAKDKKTGLTWRYDLGWKKNYEQLMPILNSGVWYREEAVVNPSVFKGRSKEDASPTGFRISNKTQLGSSALAYKSFTKQAFKSAINYVHH